MKTLLVVVSDLHINSTTGLCSPSLQLDDGGTYQLSRGQEWLYGCWANLVMPVFDRKNAGRYRKIITVVNGDLLDNNKHSGHQLITRNAAVIVNNAYSMLRGLREASDSFYVIRGTEAHTGFTGELEEILANRLEAKVDTEAGLHSWWRVQLEINNLLIDFSHHGVIGTKSWTRLGPIQAYAAEFIIEAARTKTRYPDLVFRSHRHLFGDSGGVMPVRVIQTPAFQLETAFTYRLGTVALADIGFVEVEIEEDGTYEVRPTIFRLPNRNPIQE